MSITAQEMVTKGKIVSALEPKALEPCNICKADNREEIDAILEAETVPKREIGKQFDMTSSEVNNHAMEHYGMFKILKSNVEILDPILREMTNKKDMLWNNVISLGDRLDKIMERPINDDAATKSIVSIMREVRQTLETVAKLDGELKQEQVVVYQNFVELKQVVVGELCPNCKARVIGKLSQQ